MITMSREKCKQYVENYIESNFNAFDHRVEMARTGNSYDTMVGKTKDNRPIWFKIVNRNKLVELGFPIKGGVFTYAIFQSPHKTFVFDIMKEAAE
jgi:hypothetical protein